VKSFPKPARYRNQKYLAWIRKMPCYGCGAPGPSDPHHVPVNGTGQATKPSDFFTLPLCRHCHSDIYNVFNKEEMFREVARLLERWIREHDPLD